MVPLEVSSQGFYLLYLTVNCTENTFTKYKFTINTSIHYYKFAKYITAQCYSTAFMPWIFVSCKCLIGRAVLLFLLMTIRPSLSGFVRARRKPSMCINGELITACSTLLSTILLDSSAVIVDVEVRVQVSDIIIHQTILSDIFL